MSNNSTIIEGQVIHIGQIEQKSDKFRMRLIVIKTNDKYPQEIPVQFTNANVDKTDSLKIGDAVAVSCNIRGRAWSEKWYVSLDAWRVELSANQPTAPQPIPAIGQQPTSYAPPLESAKSDEDLPF